MLPQHFVLLAQLPRLPNGKTDRAALPKPPDATTSVEHKAKAHGRLPVTPTEKAIADVWRELLDVEEVTLDDNFFNLGGHSLLAMKAVTEIMRRTCVTISVRRIIFETLGQLAATGTTDSSEPSAATPKPAPQPDADTEVKSGWLNRILRR